MKAQDNQRLLRKLITFQLSRTQKYRIISPNLGVIIVLTKLYQSYNNNTSMETIQIQIIKQTDLG